MSFDRIDVRRAVLTAAFALAALAASPARSAPSPSPEPTAELKPCTEILVQLDAPIQSGSAQSGDVFRFHSIDTVVTEDGVTIPNATPGYGVVAFASAAGAHGKGGDLIIEARYLDVPHHGHYQIMIDSLSQQSRMTGSTGNAAPALSAIPLPFVGTAVGAFNYFHPGKNVTIAKGARFDVVPVESLEHGLGCDL